MALLAAEITARPVRIRACDTGPGRAFRRTAVHQNRRAATPEQKARLQNLSPADVRATVLAGEPIITRLTRAPGNDEPIGGLKVVAANGWFAARPSGTENLYKIYAESFRSRSHLDDIVGEAQSMVDAALAG